MHAEDDAEDAEVGQTAEMTADNESTRDELYRLLAEQQAGGEQDEA